MRSKDKFFARHCTTVIGLKSINGKTNSRLGKFANTVVPAVANTTGIAVAA